MAERTSSPEWPNNEGCVEEPRFERVELKYCERCGVLGIQHVQAPIWLDASGKPRHCNACKESLRWLVAEVRS